MGAGARRSILQTHSAPASRRDPTLAAAYRIASRTIQHAVTGVQEPFDDFVNDNVLNVDEGFG